MWFTVTGDPRPQGSKRGFVTKTGRVAMVDMSAGLKQWRTQIADEARSAARIFNWVVTDDPMNVSLRFTVKKPQRPKYQFPSRPDLDKMVRAAFDGITDSGAVWVDDAHAVTLTAAKTFGEPGLSVLVWKSP